MKELWDADSNQGQSGVHPFTLQYLGLRTAVGAIGLLLPWILVFGNQWLFAGQRMENSLSAYYYTDMRDVFVGALCAIAVFMASYRGTDWKDNWAANFACVCALGVAWFPTTPDEYTTTQKWIGKVHYTSAALLFGTLAVFCLFILGKTDTPAAAGTPKKKIRDRVHIWCGGFIIASIVVASVAAALPDHSAFNRYYPIFWAEAV